MRRSDLRRDMIAFDLPRLLLVTLLSVALTSSVSARPDDLDIHDKPVAPRNPNSLKLEQKYQIVRTARSSKSFEHRTESAQNSTKQDFSIGSNSTAIVHSSDVIDDKKEWAEGGPIPITFLTTQRENTINKSAAAIESDKPNESRMRENMPKERYADPSIVARKGVEPRKEVEPKKGIQARKGADPEILNHATSDYTKSMETSSVTEAIHINNQTETSNSSISKLDTSNSRSSDNSDHNIHSNYSSTSLAPANVTTSPAKTTVIHNATTTTPKTSSHIPKPKPTVTTVDGPEVNESRSSSRTKSSSLGMPRKIDYIAPVIITIIAIPILGAAIFMLYRRGRDCWDKRHYRRMDFLIDGMYND